MTLFTVIKLADRYKLKLNEILITVCKVAASVCGTSANLIEGDVLSVEQLLYGLMLPSGNDAGYAIANHFGQLIIDHGNETKYMGTFESEF